MIYIYRDEETAKKVAKTLERHFGWNVKSCGSALRMEPSQYKRLLEDTMAPAAEWVGEVAQ